jgi:ABC-type dipeptide/oligopeptide/nickel transport system ATPase component
MSFGSYQKRAASPTVTDTLLDVEGLRVSYGTSRGRVMAVDGLTFSLHWGETFGLVGESGSGKTTMAGAVLGLLGAGARIEGGRVVLDGIDLLALSPEQMREIRWAQVALIPQGAMNSLNPVVKVRDQIRDVILVHEGRRARAGLDRRIGELLQSVGLPELVAKMYPHELSGGMKQRVCIAMAIALQPALIIADEPTSALDVVVQRLVAETLQRAQRRLGASMILIGHDMGIQAQLVDRLGIMYRGRLVEVGPVRNIFKDPRHGYTRQLIASIPSIKRPVRLADGKRLGAVLPESDVDASLSQDRDTSDELPPLREVAPGHFAALG